MTPPPPDLEDAPEVEAPPPLPELQDMVLDAATLTQLVADLETHAEVLDVRSKGGASRRASAAPLELREGVDQLLGGQVFGIQVRYLYEGSEWRDTLMRTEQGVRLVRMQMPDFS